MKNHNVISNITGAFADAAILLPLLASMSALPGARPAVLLLSAAIAYIVAAFMFRVPMAVQPLKSIAVAALSVGASFDEIRISAFLVGVFCLLACTINLEKWSKKIPEILIHQIQMGLGVLLMFQGMKYVGGMSFWGQSPALAVLGLFVVVLIVRLPRIGGIPLLGLVASAGVMLSLFVPEFAPIYNVQASITSDLNYRWDLILGLVLPQLALTSANSVLATKNVCQHYFAERANRVTHQRLLLSIGAGNMLSGLVGGMPFCHGSGGVTAHVRGGSTQSWSTALMGAFLLCLSVYYFIIPQKMFGLPTLLMFVLLTTTGVFHFQLARVSMKLPWGKIKLFISLATILLTQNLLWVLAVGISMEMLNIFGHHLMQSRRSV